MVVVVVADTGMFACIIHKKSLNVSNTKGNVVVVVVVVDTGMFACIIHKKILKCIQYERYRFVLYAIFRYVSSFRFSSYLRDIGIIMKHPVIIYFSLVNYVCTLYM